MARVLWGSAAASLLLAVLVLADPHPRNVD